MKHQTYLMALLLLFVSQLFPLSLEALAGGPGSPVSWMGYHGKYCQWQQTSKKDRYIDFDPLPTPCALVTQMIDGLEVTSFSNSLGLLPGIRFRTGDSGGVFEVCAITNAGNNTDGSMFGVDLELESGIVLTRSSIGKPNSGPGHYAFFPFTLCGLLKLGSRVSTSILIRGMGRESGKNLQVGDGEHDADLNAITWIVKQVS